MVNFIKHKNIFLVFTLLVVAACVASIAYYKFQPGIEFTGGSVVEIEYRDARPANTAIQEKIAGVGLKDVSVYAQGDKGLIIRTETIDATKHADLIKKLGETGALTERSFETIGPVVGKELTGKTVGLVIVSLIAMLIYIAVAFRNVPGPVSSWQYGLASFLILAHDVLVPLGVFAVLGALYGVQITIPIITALLTVVGYAINNVIVVYDRIRENLLRDHKADFAEISNRAINQTLSRQINTSVATLLPIFAIYFWAGASLKYFALALILGIVTGTYSSVFLASQLLLIWMNRKGQK
ncbi:MAG: protein translocase subunit SecF [Candidatus Pacebacteria bacterium]|nr:protein translocase subunit SecF [Candidatus Paceibacterota bacterium]